MEDNGKISKGSSSTRPPNTCNVWKIRDLRTPTTT